MLAASADMWLAMTATMFGQEDRLEQLGSLTVPVLVVVGEQDRPFVGWSERMAKAIPGARLAVIADAGHSPQVESPEAWWTVLTGFLQEVAAQFHLLWTKGKDEATLRFLVADADLTRARLALVRAVALVIASGLAVFGVEPVEEM